MYDEQLAYYTAGGVSLPQICAKRLYTAMEVASA